MSGWHWDVLRDPAVTDWVKEGLISALARDPVDAAKDARLLAVVLEERAERALRVEATC